MPPSTYDTTINSELKNLLKEELYRITKNTIDAEWRLKNLKTTISPLDEEAVPSSLDAPRPYAPASLETPRPKRQILWPALAA